MPALHELSVLFSADLTRTGAELRPPFRLGTFDACSLSDVSPHLHTVTVSNMQPADPIFHQLPRDLDALHIRAACDHYFPDHYLLDRSPPRSFQEAPLTSSTALTALEHISHLTDLTKLTLTLDHFPTGTLIGAIAAACPCLHSLKLEYLGYPHGEIFDHDVRDDTHLQPDPSFEQQEPQERAARWFFTHLPTLQSIAFPWQHWITWDPSTPLEKITWETYDRSILQFEYPSTPSLWEDDDDGYEAIIPEMVLESLPP
ncbi:hypothetical protein B0H17DRAFT_647461 [Mycena rosella]|uniref:Uncharacterized protein n=1 Tax=Mycena rosella TaxID=1033263 RepID=A0AAD7DDL8_MYCRO|nr:hypothetical protein B0H17DRAFT_647461 [Mycena rosella]